jgi:hypothetical protein
MGEVHVRDDAGESLDGDDAQSRRHRGFWRFWGSLPGLLGAIAALITAVATLAALFVHQTQVLEDRTEALEQATSQPTPTVTVTSTVTATPSSLPTVGTGSAPTAGATPGSPLPFGGRYLADLEPVGKSAAADTGQAVLSNQAYPKSVLMSCSSGGTYMIYNTSGMSRLTAQLGVADNAVAASGGIADIAVYDQDDRKIGETVSVSLAHPQPVDLSIGGVVQAKITCAARDRVTDRGRAFYVTLGDAALVP